MNENFIKASKIRMDLENEINNLNDNRQFNIKYEESDNFAQEFIQAQQQLETVKQRFDQGFSNLQNLYHTTQQQLINKGENFPNYTVYQRKISNLDSQIKEIETDFMRSFRIKQQKLNQEKKKSYLYGDQNYQLLNQKDKDDSTITILQQESKIIDESLRDTHDMITTGQNILHSFSKQRDTLKKTQRKVLTIANEIRPWFKG
ncbi:hypothetical protein PPERSA_04254 [Pseudocohnilembus persalinus]|uniref:Uncharacterized protein n=1 Tax=Pseudocohnilembus persalinus TaxID=266149 RepID=A0A0V0QNA2_PSEPJ|nr:hypothetical protein PPERSA_04254 [Pseudocohnilembus persalinus]|eukprot:KRX03746.1 hypothetical protein PPERSA_04254 [Pseudocohnilembus persalinus]